MQERFVYSATMLDNFQIIEPILQTTRSSCLAYHTQVSLHGHQQLLYGCMMLIITSTLLLGDLLENSDGRVM
jgi:hypothetical protein